MTSTEGALLFFDDFSGTELDRSTWNVRTTDHPVNREVQAYVDSPETIQLVPHTQDDTANGVLAIRAHYRPGTVAAGGDRFDFISGRIDTRAKVEVACGTISARIKCPAGQGLWPAFWALGAGRWPDVGEIDVMENVGEPEWVGVALHGTGYSGETPLVNRMYFPAGEGSTSWHVYSVDWSDSQLVFRVDGKVAYRATRQMVEHYGKWAFQGKKYLILNLALGGTYPFKTNGAREPYLGIPAPTLERIVAGEAVLLVDWVKVEQCRT